MQNTPATSSTAPRIRQAVRTANAKTAPPALPRAPLLHRLNRAVLWQLAACGTGLLLSAGQVYGGAAPFGLGLLLGCGNTYAPAAALGCLAGLLLFQPLDMLAQILLSDIEFLGCVCHMQLFGQFRKIIEAYQVHVRHSFSRFLLSCIERQRLSQYITKTDT